MLEDIHIGHGSVFSFGSGEIVLTPRMSYMEAKHRAQQHAADFPGLFAGLLLVAGCTCGETKEPARTQVTQTPATMEELAAQAARSQVDMPGGKVEMLRKIWEDHAPDLWGASVVGERGRLNAVLHIAGGARVTVPAGLAQAGRVLAGLRVDHDWKGSLIFVVAAAGGMTAGWPDYAPTPTETRQSDGGMRLVLAMPESQVRYAAAGGAGPPPSASSAGPVGLAPPEPKGEAVLDIGKDLSLRWRYTAGGKELASCAGEPATAPPALGPRELLRVLAEARAQTRAPRAMPRTEPTAIDARWPDIVTVELCMLGPVTIDLRGRKFADLKVDPATTPPALLLPLLEATGSLPPGLLAADLLPTAKVAGGELVAEPSAGLAAWAAQGAKGLTPRAHNFNIQYLQPSPRPARVKIKLSNPPSWTYE